MKANEAPDKIYISPNSEESTYYVSNQYNRLIEYTRTDAFIEKAADYIKKDMLDNLAFQGRLHRIEIIDGIIEKFIKAMKGE